MMKNNLENLAKVLFESKLSKSECSPKTAFSGREPVHVVYGGADRFRFDTAKKFGELAIKSIDTYAPNFVEFANARWLKDAERLPKFDESIENLEFELSDNPEKVRRENFPTWFAWSVYQKTSEKLKREPVEDFRIDFEDGYGIRSIDEEDGHAISASDELAKGFEQNTLPEFIGFRIKSFAPETRVRAVRTLGLFLTNLLEHTDGNLPENFVVTLPKITRKQEVEVLAELLSEFESINGLSANSILLEIIIETPEAIINEKGEIAIRSLVKAAKGRCVAAHFGAYDYTASFGISANHQHLQHEACNFARQMMKTALTPLGIRISDSITTEMPIPIHRSETLSAQEILENRIAIENGWRKHFNNVTNSLINGFYQSWDLYPVQLVARYAAVYSFFLESQELQGIRLNGLLDKATQALMTGNQFDDAASGQGLLNFFIRALRCGAMSESEVLAATGLNATDLNSASFLQIMESRAKANAG